MTGRRLGDLDLEGRCKARWIVSNRGGEIWRVWLDPHIGEGRLRRQVK